MDLLNVAILVDLCAYAVLGYVFAKVAGRWLPAPWNEASMTVPVALAIGALITLATLPHWFVWPH